MPYFKSFLCILLPYLLCSAALAEVQQVEQNDKVAAEQAVPGSSAVYDCVHRLLAENNMERSVVTDLILFDIVIAEAKAFPGGQVPTDKARVDEFCEKHVFEKYKGLYDKAKDQRTARVKGTLAPPGQTAIETESAFIGYVNNLTSKEVWGHSEITQDALLDLSKEDPHYKLSNGAILFLKQSSQSPDLYQWEKEEFHAHTMDEEDFPHISRNDRISKSKDRFKEHLTKRFVSMLEDAQKGATSRTLYEIGIIAHGIQDLVYHRGMTINQHAGLAYGFEFKNPDYPSGDLETSRRNEARAVTKQAIALARDLIGPCWSSVVAWAGLEGKTDESRSKEFYKFARNNIGSQTIGYFSLMTYWGKSFPFWPGGSRRQELEIAQENSGLIQWNVTEVAADISASIRSDERIMELQRQLTGTCK